MPNLRPILSALPLLLLTFTRVQAATLNVPSTQYPTIQAGINAAQSGDTVLVADGTYTGPGNVDLDFNGKNITVTSVHGAASTIIDCQGSTNNPHRGFYFHSGETAAAVVSGFTVKDGVPGPNDQSVGDEIGVMNSSPTVTGCTFVNSQLYAFGVLGSAAATHCTNCTFTNSLSDVMCVGYGSSIVVNNCAFTGNFGRGMLVYGQATIANTVFNSPSAYDEALYIVGSAAISSCTFTGGQQGGSQQSGIVADGSSNVTVSNCSFTNFGGNGLTTYGTSTIMNCLFVGNKNAGMVAGGNSAITNCIFAANSGDGIIANSSIPSLVQCTITANGGNGISLSGSGSNAVLTNCIVWNDNIAYKTTGSGKVGEIGSTEPSTTATVSHCDVQGGYAGMGNINADPLFVRNSSITPSAPDYGDLHLQPGSPCIGAGTFTGAPLTDLDGVTRLSLPTIGAYDRPAHTWDATAVAVGSDNLTHLLWANMDGRNSAWTIDGKSNVTSSAILKPGSGWTAKDVSLDALGSTHILWVNPDGRMTVWTIKGSNITSLPIFQPGGGWAARALSLDGQGNAHVLWYNTDGHMAVWAITPQGSVKSTPLYQPGSGWSARSLSEDAQGSAHILWFNTDGRMAVWTITSGNAVSSTAIFQPGGNWEARKVSVDSMGNNHVLWFNTDGDMSVWTIDASSNVKSTAILQAGTGWAAQGLAVDSVGSSRVLWDNVDGRAAVWTIPVQGSVTSTPIYQP